MRHFGIIGKPLGHSFSARFFSEKFHREQIDAEYSMFPLETIDAVRPLLDRLDGMNVTIPYKVQVIPFLDRLDDTARAIGAVNVICRHVGYNTDCLGFMDSIRPLLRPTDQQALVLGSGGASKACVYGLQQLGLSVHIVSRQSERGISYDRANQLLAQGEVQVIVNATPVGMSPHVEECPPIDYTRLQPDMLLFDCIYNPEETLFLHKGKQYGCRTQNGMEMLLGQARAAWKIWNQD